MAQLEIHDLIELAGGEDALAKESASSMKPVGPDAVRKWKIRGIPDDHWSLFFKIPGVNANTLHAANERLRKGRRHSWSQMRTTAA